MSLKINWNIKLVAIFAFIIFQLSNCVIVFNNFKIKKTYEWVSKFDKYGNKNSDGTSIKSRSLI